jgi:plasmid stability protein
MKNITVSIDDRLHRRARIRAAEKGTSLSAAVREYLVSFCAGETDYERRKRLEQETFAAISSFDGGNRIGRNEVHDRNALH